jgi:putative effector of murein hydrolase LrgA (UPF0299 family)
MTILQKKILYTFIPYLVGIAIAYGVMAFITWDRDAGKWLFSDRLVAIVFGWVIGSMLYVRFEYDRVKR